ncbi:MAG: BamA/TamA family outer membrane protein, partial [Acidobacteria bacterium]|nr:BamA/TamA family outer membrane protein [Acidobacteriota bacterium]
GETLDLAAVGRSRRSLYQTGAYSSVEILRESAEPDPSAEPTLAPDASESSLSESSASESPDREQPAAEGTRPVDTRVNLREVPPFQVSYGLSFDTDGGLGGLIDASNHNSLGKARVVGVSARYDGRRRQVRLYASQPMLRQIPLQTLASLYARQERTPETATSAEFVVDRFGASLQQERKLWSAYVWNYGVSYEQARTFDPNRAGGLDETVTVTPLTSTFTRETRDEILDATRGSFASQAFTYSPEWLGSDQAFLRYYGQFFKYFALAPERRERLTNEILRPRFVFATGARLGLMRGLGGEVPRTERFFAGGGTTLRGFGEASLGPRDASGIPTGGNATLVLNAELRFPLINIVDGVGFVDIGGVSATLGDWRFSDIRETVGLGVRVRTPWFLLRGDYGFVLDGRPGEPRGRFFFSLGQAF